MIYSVEKAEFTLSECTRKNLCCDCDNARCTRIGDKGADCPKWICDNPNGLDNCDNCDFIDNFIEEMRKEYESLRGD